MKLYIAAPFTEWPTAASLRAYLRSHQIAVVSSWIDEAAALGGVEAAADLEPGEWDAIGARNDADILDSHAVIALTFADKGTEQFEECGFARRSGIPVVYTGSRVPHLSVRRACNGFAATWEEALEQVLMLARAERRTA